MLYIAALIGVSIVLLFITSFAPGLYNGFRRKYRHSRDFAILDAINRILTTTPDIEELMRSVTNEITSTLNFQACIFGLLDGPRNTLKVRAFSGTFLQGVKGINSFSTMDLNDRLTERLISGTEIIKARDLPEHLLLYKHNGSKLPIEKIDEVLFVPVKIKDHIIGLLTVASAARISRRDITLLASIANSSALAINNAMLNNNSKKYFIKTIDTLIAAIEAKDKYTEGHSQRVSKLSAAVASKLNLAYDQVEEVKIAGILHDIGKIGIRDNILQKTGALTRDEFNEVKQHPAISKKILFPAGLSDRTLKAIAFHHERYDGKGYPYGLSGEEISIEAQIIAAADAFDAMTSDRPYRPAMSREKAYSELLCNKSTQFSPKVVDAFMEMDEDLFL